jgi:hypothetical protein
MGGIDISARPHPRCNCAIAAFSVGGEFMADILILRRPGRK